MEQNHSFGKKIADLFVLLLLGVVLLFGGKYLPLIGTAAAFLWVLPVVLAVYRNGIGAGVVLCCILAILGFIWTELPEAVIIVGFMTVLALFYGICLRKKVAPGKTLCGGIFIGIAIAVFYFIVAYAVHGITFADLRIAFEEELTAAYNVYVESGVLDAALSRGLSVDAYIAELVDEMVQILPSFFFTAMIVMSAVNYFLAQLFLKRRSADIRPLPAFRDWHLPWWVLWGIVAALMFYVGGNFYDSEILLAIAKNILLCYLPILVVAGISLVRYFFVALHLSNGIQILIWVVAVLFMSVSLMFFVLIGAGDAAIDYRASFMKKKNNDVGGHTK